VTRVPFERVSLSLSVSLDDENPLRPLNYAANGSASTVPVSANTRTTTIPIDVPLAIGTNTIVLDPADMRGNRARLTLTIDRDDDVSGPLVSRVQVAPSTVAAGETVTITARIGDQMAVASATARLQRPDGTTMATVTLADNGLNGDVAAGDGIFTGRWETTGLANGPVFVDLTAQDTHAPANVTAIDNAALIDISPPLLAVSPATLTFGSIAAGQTADRSFTLANIGGGTVTGTAATSGPFTIVSGSSFSIPAGQSALVTLRFSAPAGAHSRTVSFTDQNGRLDREATGAGQPPNVAPFVSVGSDRAVHFPASATLSGFTRDDGLPASSSLGATWSVVSGPGSAVFANPGALDTLVSFSAPGLYTLRLSVTDGALTGADDLVVAANPSWAGRSRADFDNDGFADLLWHHGIDGVAGLWFMRGTLMLDGRLTDPPRVPDTRWRPMATPDMNADGEPDILWQHDDGSLAVWLMRGAQRLDVLWLEPRRVPDPAWRVRAAVDVNADGSPDLILQHQTEGWLGVWFMVGVTLVDGRLLDPARVPSTSWVVAGAADIDRDGFPDLIWHNRDTGQLACWFMNGTRSREVVFFEPSRLPDTAWVVTTVTDVNGDGKPDLLLQHSRENWIAVWLLDGIKLVDGTLLNPPRVADGWRLVGPR
jgi:hypothetical protein